MINGVGALLGYAEPAIEEFPMVPIDGDSESDASLPMVLGVPPLELFVDPVGIVSAK